MNIIVIPFLLGALVSIKNHTEWNFGPEYKFKLKKTTAVFVNSFVFENVTATIKCRPNILKQRFVDKVLVCHAYNIILSTLTQEMYENIEQGKTDNANLSSHVVTQNISHRVLKLGFSMHGVQKVRMVRQKSSAHLYDFIPDIIEQFDMGIDLSVARNSMKNYENKTSGTHVISSFTQTNEDTMKAFDCNTSVIITYTPSNHSHKNGKRRNHKNKSKSHFRLKLLPISYTNLGDKTFSIERKRMACIGQPKNIEFRNEKWKIDNYTQYYNVMKVRRRKPKFTSRTHLEGYVLFPLRNRTHYFREDVHLELHHIKPTRLYSFV